MSKYDYRVRFDGVKKRKKLTKKDESSYDELRKIISRNSDDDLDFVDLNEIDFADLKVLKKKKGRNAITSGKVLNAGRKKYHKWRKHDKAAIKEMISPSLQAMYEDGSIGYKKAKKLRKIIANRIVSCFYGSDD